jgi:hypothetical protein
MCRCIAAMRITPYDPRWHYRNVHFIEGSVGGEVGKLKTQKRLPQKLTNEL